MHCVITAAPAKIILTGEHAVVYNKHALAAAIDLYTITWSVPTANTLAIHLIDLNIFIEFTLIELNLVKQSLVNIGTQPF
jgi:mevalonate kinase